MPENDFEKRVHQELDDFKVKPSEAVWHKVEERIHQKKKRRRFLLVLFPLLLAGGTAVYFYTNGHRKNDLAGITMDKDHPTKNSTGENTAGTGTAISIQENRQTKNNIHEKRLPAASDLKKNNNNDAGNKTGKDAANKAAAAGTNPVSTGNHVPGNIAIRKDKKNSKKAAPPVLMQNDIAEKEQPVIPSGKTATKDNNDQTVSSLNTEENKRSIGPASLYTESYLLNTFLANSNIPALMLPAVPGTDAASLASASSVKKQWQTGLIIKAGIFNLTPPLFDFGPRAADYAYANPSGNGNGSSQGGAVSSPSAIRPSLSYGAGVQFKHPLGKRNFFVTGIGVGAYQTVRKVGAYKDSSGNGSSSLYSFSSYYQAGAALKDYRSRYYYLEVPVAIHWRLNKNGKSPVYLETGLGYSHLLYAKGLVYSGNNGFYINDKHLLNRDLLSSQVGILFPVFKKWQHPLQMGAYARYSLSRQYRVASNINMHGQSVGIKLTMNF